MKIFVEFVARPVTASLATSCGEKLLRRPPKFLLLVCRPALAEARRNLGNYFALYNQERLHPALRFATPEAVYSGKNLVAASGEEGALEEGEAAVTPVALRAPCVPATVEARNSLINHPIPCLDTGE